MSFKNLPMEQLQSKKYFVQTTQPLFLSQSLMPYIELCESNMDISLFILRSFGTKVKWPFTHLHMTHSKLASNIRHILSNSFPTSSFAGSIRKHCIPQVYVWSHAWFWLRIGGQIGCWLESLIFWLVYALGNLSDSSNVIHENILLKKHTLMKKTFCYHSPPSDSPWLNSCRPPSLYIYF